MTENFKISDKKLKKYIKTVPYFFGIIFSLTTLFLFPEASSNGIKEGLSLLGSDILPSLFPFMVLSAYISSNELTHKIAVFLNSFTEKIFKTSGYGFIAFVLGALGGYPVGAKTIHEYFVNGKLSQNEAERLFYWVINPSPAFVMTTVGFLMLGSLKTGVLLYVSALSASLTVGFFCRFIDNGERTKNNVKSTKAETKSNFVKAVANGSEAMLSICGWVLIFSAFSSVVYALPLNKSIKLLIASVSEVTVGCNTVVSNFLPLTVIAAVISFGGFAVICQINTYSSVCNVKLSRLICSRIINSVVTSVYFSFLLKFFPQYASVSVVIGTPTNGLTLYKSIPATLILFVMFVVFIFDVDNRKKVW